MSGLFQMVLTLSIVGTFCIAIVLLTRLLLCKAPKKFCYILWALVFVRLICPVFPESPLSLIPEMLVSKQVQRQVEEKKEVSVEVAVAEENLSSTIPKTDMKENSIKEDAKDEDVKDLETGNTNADDIRNVEHNKTIKIATMCSYIWLTGVIALAAYHISSYWRFRSRIQGAHEISKGVKEIKGEHLSFVFGIINPTIYIAEGLEAEARNVILCHENVHVYRKDYLIKPLALAICCIHWFNPFVWIAFYLMNKDCEMSCDERVVNELGEESKAIYSYALLNEATGGKRVRDKRTAIPIISFGEDGVKARIKHVLNYKKASVGILISGVGILILLAVCFLSNPKGEKQLTEDSAIQAVQKAGGYKEDVKSICLLNDYEGDKKAEAFVIIQCGLVEEFTGYIYGDLWFVSEEGETTRLLENEYIYEQEDIFEWEDKKFLLISYLSGGPDATAVYGVTDNKAENKIPYAREALVADDNSIACVQSKYEIDYDIEEDQFTGRSFIAYKVYCKDGEFIPYTGSILSEEEVSVFENGKDVLEEIKQKYSNARFQYILYENNMFYINMALISETSIHFSYMTYEIQEGHLDFIAGEDGCYKRDIANVEELSFSQEIAKEYHSDAQSFFGYMDYTGWLDECTQWSFYNNFVDQDYDKDGMPDRVYREMAENGEDGECSYRIAFGNGDELIVNDVKNGFLHIQGVDLTGDGCNEIVVSLTYVFSTNPAAFGENRIFEKKAEGYERMEWPTDIESAMSKGNPNIPKITLHYERKEYSYRVMCLELVKDAPIDVVVDIDEERWKGGYKSFDGEDIAYPMYEMNVIESEGEKPYVVGLFGTFDKWSADRIQVTFVYEDGGLRIKEALYVR
ncbi:M56 family metallopeptidase [Anaerosporobacter sp.]|uniref:M56 family metallopeptidase n=1 Tax=Anaerosporobacter sp. TaxID=1872529 RepID=UPI00286F4475|nr:M56 family metallopeptidase [Anaerosporobacter sp.]